MENSYFKISNILLIIPLLLVIATVVVVSTSMMNPTVSGKYVWFAITLPLAIISTFILIIKNRKEVRSSAVDILLSIFCVWGILYSYYLLGEFSIKLNILLLLGILYFVCRITFSQTRYFYDIALFFLIVCGFIESVWGLGQLYGYFQSYHKLFKITGSFYNPGPYAGFLSLVLPVTLYYILFDYPGIRNSKEKNNNTFLYIRWGASLLTFLSIISVLPATMSRASWLAAIISCSTVGLAYFLSKKEAYVKTLLERNKKKVFFVSISFLFLFSAFFYLSYNLKKDSADGRSFIWQNTLEVLEKNPEGIGIGRFAKYYGEQQVGYFANNEASDQQILISGNPEYAFNEYLQIGVELGFLSLLIFLFGIGYALYTGFRNRKYAAAGSLLALLVFAFFSYPFNLLPFLITLVVLLALCITDNQENKQLKKVNVVALSFFMVCCFAVTSFIIFKHYPVYNAYQEWKEIKLVEGESDEQASGRYSKIVNYLGHENLLLFEYAQCLNRLGEYEKSNHVLNRMADQSCDPMVYNVMGRNYQSLGNYHLAEKSFQNASLIVPSRIYPYYLLLKMYDEQGKAEQVLHMAGIILKKHVKVDSPAIKQIKGETEELYKKYTSN